MTLLRLRTAVTLGVALTIAAPLVATSTTSPATAASSASSASTASTASSDAVRGGPRPTSIRLSADDASSTVLVHGLGSASAAQARENRSMRHSDRQPTGRFAANGDVLTVTVPDGAPTMSIAIGLIGVHAAHNGGVDRGQWSAALKPGVNTITAPLDGMVHLTSTADGGSADVVIEGGRPVPVFVAGQTTNEALRAEMARLADAPFVQVVGDRFFGDFQTDKTGTVIATADVATRVAELDRAIEVTNRTYGLRDDGTGLARKAGHRIYVAAPDTSGGYANATHERVTFPVGTGAAADLFRAAADDQWGWWHEVGHTYQTPTFNWGGQGEVLVNLSPLHIQSAFGFSPRLDRMVGGYDAFFAQPVDQRSYAAEPSLWVRLFLHDQLRRAFGDDFYPRLNQEFRVMKELGESQPFAVTASRVADRDLSEYFRQWGFDLDDATKAALAEFPPLENPIWENRLSTSIIREHLVPPYSVPVGALHPTTDSMTLGQRQLRTPPTASELRDSDGDGEIRIVPTEAVTHHLGSGAARLTAINDTDVREVLSTPVTVTRGSSFELRGLSNRVIADLALQPSTRELRMFARTAYNAHLNFGAEEYVGGTVFDTRGRERASFSVAGNENAHAAAAAFDGTSIDEGGYLTVRHREAGSRASRWDADLPVARNDAGTQHYRVDGGRLVAVDRVPTPPDGSITAVPADGTILLTRGSSAAVPVTVEATTRVSSVETELTLSAPSGTVFSDGQEALVTELRLPGGQWVVTRDVVAARGVTSDDGGTLTLTVRGADGLDLPDGTRLRWTPRVTVPDAGAAVGGGLDWTLAGTADGARVVTGT
jgi:hypothetical protein